MSCLELCHHILQLSSSYVQEAVRHKPKSTSQITIDTKNVPKSIVAFRWNIKVSPNSIPRRKVKGLSSCFSENYIQRNGTHKRCSASPIIMEVQLKPHSDGVPQALRRTITSKQKIRNINESMKDLEPCALSASR